MTEVRFRVWVLCLEVGILMTRRQQEQAFTDDLELHYAQFRSKISSRSQRAEKGAAAKAAASVGSACASSDGTLRPVT